MQQTYSEQILSGKSKSLKSWRLMFLQFTAKRCGNHDISQEVHKQFIGQVELCAKPACCKLVLLNAHKIRNVFQKKIIVLVTILHESDRQMYVPQSRKKW